ncbi:MAG: hypothetical protein ACM3Q2_08025 [Syntrophothermus sp.]
MKKIINQVLILFLVVYITLAILYKNNTVSYAFLSASFYAGLINLLNVAAAVAAFNLSLRKSQNMFLIYNMGGMVARLFILLAIFVIFLKFLNIDEYGFIFTFFVLYFVSLILEINYFRIKAVKNKN